jgi:hypothetical protein
MGNASISTDLEFPGSLYVWNPAKNNFSGGWSKIGSASGGFEVSGNKLRVTLGGYQFWVSVNLP